MRRKPAARREECCRKPAFGFLALKRRNDNRRSGVMDGRFHASTAAGRHPERG